MILAILTVAAAVAILHAARRQPAVAPVRVRRRR